MQGIAPRVVEIKDNLLLQQRHQCIAVELCCQDENMSNLNLFLMQPESCCGRFTFKLHGMEIVLSFAVRLLWTSVAGEKKKICNHCFVFGLVGLSVGLFEKAVVSLFVYLSHMSQSFFLSLCAHPVLFFGMASMQ